jgi:sugar phosphate isomerase/epimerase
MIPLVDILAGLSRLGFHGLCSIELFRPAYWERDPAELAAAARAATVDIVGNHFEVA